VSSVRFVSVVRPIVGSEELPLHPTRPDVKRDEYGDEDLPRDQTVDEDSQPNQHRNPDRDRESQPLLEKKTKEVAEDAIAVERSDRK
jgi:hypothetical protein